MALGATKTPDDTTLLSNQTEMAEAKPADAAEAPLQMLEKTKSDGPTPPGPDELYANHVHWNPAWEEISSGLTHKEAEMRYETYGPNGLADDEVPWWVDYLKCYWGPMPIMIWLCMLILLLKSTIPGSPKPAWAEFITCTVLQLVNANLKYYNGQNAKNAINALKSKMAPRAFVKRDGDWTETLAIELVPGDVIQINIGMIVPADCRLGPCENISADQSALTGESLPKSCEMGDVLYSSSVIKRGEGEGIVVGTGERTEMGKSAKLVAGVKKVSRYDMILYYIATFLLTFACVAMTIQFIFLITVGEQDFLTSLSSIVVLLIGAIPIAMHVVCMLVMAIGAYRLTSFGAVVSELTATEELSGMSILCSDKTGTLTYNRLEIIKDRCESYGKFTLEELYWFSLLACKRATQGQDAIDSCITKETAKHFPEKYKEEEAHEQTNFMPFDPVAKRTEATVKCPDGSSILVTKGAPQVILSMCEKTEALSKQCEATINTLARAGYRTIGVARAIEAEELCWEMVGLLAIADPPRKDTASVIENARKLGIKVIMITGDQTAIAQEVCKQIGIADSNPQHPLVLSAALLSDIDRLPIHTQNRLGDICERCDGFAEVFPEHKFQVVQELQRKGHIVGMTGDGVNDAPALKLANVGIAVSGATDAARAASCMFLQREGLTVIIAAILRSKKVYERVKNYIIYRCATSMRLMGFFFLSTLFISPASFLPAYKDEYLHDQQYCRDFVAHPEHKTGTVASLFMKGTDKDYTMRAGDCNWRDVDDKDLKKDCKDPYYSTDATKLITRYKKCPYQLPSTFIWRESCVKAYCERGDITGDEKTEWCNLGKQHPKFFPFTGEGGCQFYVDPTATDKTAEKNTVATCFSTTAEDELTFQKIPKAAQQCVERLLLSDGSIDKVYETPLMVVLVLLILNDFTVVTIAFDHVEISDSPDEWKVFRNIFIGCVIGCNTLTFSLIIFIMMLWAMDPNSGVCQDLKICLAYPEVIVGTFLQLCLSGRLSRTNARTHKWFCELGLKRSVIVTMSFSIVMAIVLAFTWPLCPGSPEEGWSCSPHHSKVNPRMVAFIVLCQLFIHTFRDVSKKLCYWYFAKLDTDAAAEKQREKLKIDRDVQIIMAELGYINLEEKPAPMANSVTLQAISRERSQRFIALSETEKEEIAMKIARTDSQKTITTPMAAVSSSRAITAQMLSSGKKDISSL